jgi:hypothetical protein
VAVECAQAACAAIECIGLLRNDLPVASPTQRTPMLVIDRNGRRIVITGWRAWLIVGPAMLLAAVALVAVVSLLLGVAITVATIALFALPLAIGLVLLIGLFQPKP